MFDQIGDLFEDNRIFIHLDFQRFVLIADRAEKNCGIAQ